MENTENIIPADYIMPLNINGLTGRLLRAPSLKKKNANKEILMIYGHHSSLERMYGIVENFASFANVTMPDLPGFGGMDSYYILKDKPTLDNLADYLATLIKLKYKKRRFSIVGMSFGFVVATKMLQKYPEIADQVDTVISLVGFSNKEDFKFKKKNYTLLKNSSYLLSGWLTSSIVKHIALRGPFITATYNLLADKHVKMKDADKTERQKRIKFEIKLWQINDPRTYMKTSYTMLTLDITKQKVPLPLIHISVDNDQYFDNRHVKKNLKKIYESVEVIKAKMPNHAPTVISTAKEAESFVPKALKQLMPKLIKAN